MKAEGSLRSLDSSPPQSQKFWSSVSCVDFLTQVWLFFWELQFHAHLYFPVCVFASSPVSYPGMAFALQCWVRTWNRGVFLQKAEGGCISPAWVGGFRMSRYSWHLSPSNNYSGLCFDIVCLRRVSDLGVSEFFKRSVFLSSSFFLLCVWERMELIHVLDQLTLNEHTACAESSGVI